MSFDPQLDAQLRDVPLPSGMIERLKASIMPTEAEIDERLREVEFPGGLLAQLHDIPHDDPLDEVLRDVSVPFELVWRARRQPWTRRTRRAIELAGNLALALLLFVVIYGGLTVGTGAFTGHPCGGTGIRIDCRPAGEARWDVRRRPDRAGRLARGGRRRSGV
jgi:hypothetical protein